MAKSKDYWRKRFEDLENDRYIDSLDYIKDLETQYKSISKQLESDISVWYQRFAKNNEISLADAKKLLNTKELKEFKWTVDEYIKKGIQNSVNPIWVKQLENASARVHISRLESLKVQLQQNIELLYGNRTDEFDEFLSEIYSDNYYKTTYEINKGNNIGINLQELNKNQLELILKRPWTQDNTNFSKRMWKNQTELMSKINTHLTQGIVLGESPDKIIRKLTKDLNVDKSKVSRLVMTESAAFASNAQKRAYKDLDVEKFEFVATLDRRTSEICRNMDGQVFEMSEYSVGLTAPPLHPWCRSVTVPYFEDNYTERFARDNEGNTYYVDGDMKYDEWYKQYIEGVPVEPEVNLNVIKVLSKLKNSGMNEYDYDQYLNLINGNDNPNIKKLYVDYADKIGKVQFEPFSGSYSDINDRIKFDYPKYDDMNKYGTIAHEYGHYFDNKVSFTNLHFTEIEAVRDTTGLKHTFKSVASSSDEFLQAVRKDKDYLKSIYSKEFVNDLSEHNASHGVQDTIDGLFARSRIIWGHGDKYYNRKYADIEFMDKLSKSSRKKALKKLYTELGFDASNQGKVKSICRQYEAASEMWANIISAEVCGGEELKYIKLYLPNSYKSMMSILKGVK